MPGLGNLSLSSSLTLTRCPTLKSPPLAADSPESTESPYLDSVKTLVKDPDVDRALQLPIFHNDEGCNAASIRVSRRSRGSPKGSNRKALEDHVTAWIAQKMDSAALHSRCSLPFLLGAKKLVTCLACCKFIYPGEDVCCSVRGCQGVYHSICAKEKLGIFNLKTFKCPQHACFVCKQRLHWRCVRCTIASHDKCAPWPDEVFHLETQPGRAVCWRHPTDWRLDKEHAVATCQIEEIFCRLPLPYVVEEFKIDSILKDIMENKIDPPPYVHIRRNIYLVKKKRDDANDDIGCTHCNFICSEDCVCRVQCISCSKACRCSETCNNRPFRKEKKIKIVKTELCGWGVEAAEPLKKGDFVIEYIGEVIDDASCEQRLWDMKYKGVKNFYMCEIRKDFTIDATFKGNSSRFLNHSCDPNCVLEKWQVDGETRVGVFAARSIKVGEQLTYDYRFVQFGPEVKCYCGTPNCQGYLGTKKKVSNLDLCWGSKRQRSSTLHLATITA
ncbi:SET domain-containing protein [Cephalotus follicularis]|uniref:SET domain-containing protein n=1 Tax=Cephalotus follicularis TaxID=3775 RepID=A0A1Q3CBT8_CEPFO|nr:SET domain-containing protein [Cephalotus follicularis]